MTDAITVAIRRKMHSYDIVIGSFLPTRWLDEVETRVPASTYILVADENVAAHFPVLAAAGGRAQWHALTIGAGEENKTLNDYARLLDALLSFPVDRQTVVVAMGGGVVGDLAGFAAATLLRGVRFVQIPTTLLAQVDSSVGGKVGVNAAAGKNLVGAFHQPEAVLIDAAFLSPLPVREYLAGLAEVVKYGILGDREFFTQLTATAPRLIADPPDSHLLERVVAHCCRMKRDVVAGDETEKGKRGLLNFGHTFGHILESLAGYDGSVVHGEAVAVGMVMAARFALDKGLLPNDEHAMLVPGLERLSQPTRLNQLGHGREDENYWRDKMQPQALEKIFLKDKKAASGLLTLILPHAVGDCRIHSRVPVAEAIETVMRFV